MTSAGRSAYTPSAERTVRRPVAGSVSGLMQRIVPRIERPLHDIEGDDRLPAGPDYAGRPGTTRPPVAHQAAASRGRRVKRACRMRSSPAKRPLPVAKMTTSAHSSTRFLFTIR